MSSPHNEFSRIFSRILARIRQDNPTCGWTLTLCIRIFNQLVQNEKLDQTISPNQLQKRIKAIKIFKPEVAALYLVTSLFPVSVVTHIFHNIVKWPFCNYVESCCKFLISPGVLHLVFVFLLIIHSLGFGLLTYSITWIISEILHYAFNTYFFDNLGVRVSYFYISQLLHFSAYGDFFFFLFDFKQIWYTSYECFLMLD